MRSKIQGGPKQWEKKIQGAPEKLKKIQGVNLFKKRLG